MDAPYETETTIVDAQGGQPVVVPLGVVGYLTRLAVAQTAGAREGFTATVYSNQAAASGDAVPLVDRDGDSVGSVPGELYRRLPVQTAASGQDLLEYFAANGGVALGSRTGTGGWLVIVPGGSGAKKFAYNADIRTTY